MNLLSFLFKVIISLLLISCAGIKPTTNNQATTYKEDTCILYTGNEPIEFQDSILSEDVLSFYSSTKAYDILYIKIISGKNNIIFRRLSLDSTGIYYLTIKSNKSSKIEMIENKAEINNLLKNIDKDHHSEICSGYQSISENYILLLRIKGETVYSLSLNRGNLQGLKDSDKSKILNGYNLLRYIESL